MKGMKLLVGRLLNSLTIGALMILPLTGSAQPAPESGNYLTSQILELLAEPHSQNRDRRLYESAVELFQHIEAGLPTAEEVEHANLAMARALHEAAEGGVADAWIDYG